MANKPLRASECLYRALLYVYPSQHRRVYGEQMAQTFNDLCHQAVAQGGNFVLLRLWLNILADIAVSASVEHLAAIGKGMHMSRKGIATLVLVLIFGLITGYVDLNASEVLPPLMCLLLFSFLAGFIQPKAAWRWGVLIGLSIPLSYFVGYAINYKIVDPPHLPITLVVLVIPALIAAYGGVLVNALTLPHHPGV